MISASMRSREPRIAKATASRSSEAGWLRPTTMVFGLLYCLLLGMWNSLCAGMATWHDTPDQRHPTGQGHARRRRRHLAEANGRSHGVAEASAIGAAAIGATAIGGGAVSSDTGGHADVQASAACPGRRSYHTLLTTQASIYQQWQSRIMYYHFLKQKRLDGPCTEMGVQ